MLRISHIVTLIFSNVGGIIMCPQKMWKLRLRELNALPKASQPVSGGAKSSDQCAKSVVFPFIAPVLSIISLHLPFSSNTYNSVKVGHLQNTNNFRLYGVLNWRHKLHFPMHRSLPFGILQLPPNSSFEFTLLIFQIYPICCSQSDLYEVQFWSSHHKLKTFNVFPVAIRIDQLLNTPQGCGPCWLIYFILCHFLPSSPCPGHTGLPSVPEMPCGLLRCMKFFCFHIPANIFSSFVSQIPLSMSQVLIHLHNTL